MEAVASLQAQRGAVTSRGYIIQPEVARRAADKVYMRRATLVCRRRRAPVARPPSDR